MAKDGFEVELDDLATFNKTIKSTGEDFRDGGFQTLAALSEFTAASGLHSTGLHSVSSVYTQNMDAQLAATEVHQYTSLGLSTLASGADVIRQSYVSADGHGAATLAKIDAGVVDKMFANPKKDDKKKDKKDKEPSKQEVDAAQQDLVDRLTETAEESNDALKQGVDSINEGAANYYVDSYNGSTVVTVPEQGDQPGREYTSPGETELSPDLPDIDKYDESTREQDVKDLVPEPDQP